jgi:hypothetical protein
MLLIAYGFIKVEIKKAQIRALTITFSSYRIFDKRYKIPIIYALKTDGEKPIPKQ